MSKPWCLHCIGQLFVNLNTKRCSHKPYNVPPHPGSSAQTRPGYKGGVLSNREVFISTLSMRGACRQLSEANMELVALVQDYLPREPPDSDLVKRVKMQIQLSKVHILTLLSLEGFGPLVTRVSRVSNVDSLVMGICELGMFVKVSAEHDGVPRYPARLEIMPAEYRGYNP